MSFAQDCNCKETVKTEFLEFHDLTNAQEAIDKFIELDFQFDRYYKKDGFHHKLYYSIHLNGKHLLSL